MDRVNLLLEEFKISSEAGDINTLMSLYAEDDNVFQITSRGKICKGRDSIRDSYEKLFKSFSFMDLQIDEYQKWRLNSLIFVHFKLDGRVKHLLSGDILKYRSIGTFILNGQSSDTLKIVFEQFTLFS